MKDKVKGSYGFMSRHRFGAALFMSVFVFVCACFGLVAANGESVGPSDAHLINLSIDGNEEFVPSRAATVGEFISKSNIPIRPADIVEPKLEASITTDNFKIRVLRAEPTTILDANKSITLLSPYKDPKEAAEKAGIELRDADEVIQEFSGNPVTTRIVGRKLVVKRSKRIFINIYGTPVEKYTMARTVGDLLAEMNITPGDSDTLKPAVSEELKDSTHVFLTKLGKVVKNVEEDIAFETSVTEDPDKSVGSVEVVQAGVKGRRIVTYELTLENGEETARRVIQEAIVKEPKTEKVIRGTRPLFADYNSDGIPARVFCGSPKQRNWKNINVGNAAAGRALAEKQGWGESEFDALLELWACESSWNERAGNPFSGAYGIPQSWPAEKMSSFGPDYRTNPLTQMRWGIDYIARRFGTPSAALAFHYRTNYY